jgi:hypothetical protein
MNWGMGGLSRGGVSYPNSLTITINVSGGFSSGPRINRNGKIKDGRSRHQHFTSDDRTVLGGDTTSDLLVVRPRVARVTPRFSRRVTTLFEQARLHVRSRFLSFERLTSHSRHSLALSPNQAITDSLTSPDHHEPAHSWIRAARPLFVFGQGRLTALTISVSVWLFPVLEGVVDTYNVPALLLGTASNVLVPSRMGLGILPFNA